MKDEIPYEASYSASSIFDVDVRLKLSSYIKSSTCPEESHDTAKSIRLLSVTSPVLFVSKNYNENKSFKNLLRIVVEDQAFERCKSNKEEVDSSFSIPILYINAGKLFSGRSLSLNHNTSSCDQFIEADRLLQQEVNYAVSKQPCVLVIEDLHIIAPHTSTNRYFSNSVLFEENSKVISTFLNCQQSQAYDRVAVIGIVSPYPSSTSAKHTHRFSIHPSVRKYFHEVVYLSTTIGVKERRNIIIRAISEYCKGLEPITYDASRVDSPAIRHAIVARISSIDTDTWASQLSSGVWTNSTLHAYITQQLVYLCKHTHNTISFDRGIGIDPNLHTSAVSQSDVIDSSSSSMNMESSQIQVNALFCQLFNRVYDVEVLPVNHVPSIPLLIPDTLPPVSSIDLLQPIQCSDKHVDNVNEVMNKVSNSKSSSSSTTSSRYNLAYPGVCGHHQIKSELTEAVMWPRWFPALYKQYEMVADTGILLYGPPGTGKTLFPGALATELKCSLINLRLTDVVRGTIGTGEQALRDAFQRARLSAPSIVFIDEFQAIFTSRGSSGGDGSDSFSVGSSLTYALSSCFDDVILWNQHAGVESLITVLAATNEPWAIDTGFLRPGRLERRLFVGPLDENGRKEYFTRWFDKKLKEYDNKKKRNSINNNSNNNNNNNSSNSGDSFKQANNIQSNSRSDLVVSDKNANTIIHFEDMDEEEEEKEERMKINNERNKLITRVIQLTDLFTGADCALLIKRACLNCLVDFQHRMKLKYEEYSHNHHHHHEMLQQPFNGLLLPALIHFEQALKPINNSMTGMAYNGLKASVTLQDLRVYDRWNKELK